MQLLEQHFDAAFAAPDGIKKLRELILTLAMQGKLVEQDPSDQPASELLKEIEQEKRRLVLAGKIKAPKALPTIEAGEAPYAVPTGWEWVRLGSIVNISTGKLDANAAVKGGKYPFFTCSSTPSEIDSYSFDTSAVLLAGNGDFNTKLYTGKFDAYQRTYVIEPVFINLEYVYFIIKLSINEISSENRGSAIPFLRLADITHQVIPLPPLAEQRRIVARIDDLMARCDALEALHAEREQKRLDAHTAALNALLSAREPAAFAEAWQFMTQHFSDLHSVPKNVAELRKAVLQLAVMGKLVEQDPNDPPASELLKEIQEEKKRLIVAGKIRASKPLPPVTPEEMPYPVPTGWEWVRMGELGVWKSGSTPSRSNSAYYGGDIPWIKSGEVKKGRINESEEFITPLAIKECALEVNEAGAILVAMYGANIGEVGILEINAATNQAICACKAYSGIDKIFLLNLISSMKSRFIEQGAGAAQPNISREKIVNSIIPLPPLPEQRRIVAKIDQLLALCDQLEVRLAAQTGTQSALLASVMAAVTPANASPTRRAAPARAPAGEPVRRGPGRPRKEVTEASSEDGEVTVVRRKPGRPRKEPAEAISAEATPVTARRGPGRPRKNPAEPTRSIPEATSTTDAIRRLEALKIERATGTRQVGLFESEAEVS